MVIFSMVMVWDSVYGQESQTDSLLYWEIRAVARLDANIQVKDSILRNALDKAHELRDTAWIAWACYELGRVHKATDNYQIASHWYGESYNARKTLAPSEIDPFLIARSAYWAASMALEGGLRLQAMEYYKATIDVGDLNYYVPRCYKWLAHFQRKIGNYTLAWEYWMNAMSIAEHIDVEDQVLHYTEGLRIATDEEHRDTLLSLINRIEALKDSIDAWLGRDTRSEQTQKRDLAVFYTAWALAYQQVEQYAQSEQFNFRALNLTDELEQKANINNNLGIVYRRIGNLEKSDAYFKAALRIHRKRDVDQDLAGTHDNLGDHYRDLGDYPKAITHYDSAILLNFPDYDVRQPTLQSKFSFSSSEQLDLIKYFGDRAWCMEVWHRNSPESIDLQEALIYYDLADKLIDSVRLTLPGEAAQFIWRSKARDIYERAALCAARADLPTQALRYIESGKAIVLAEALKHSDARAIIPDSLNMAIENLRAQKEQLAELRETQDTLEHGHGRISLSDTLFRVREALYDLSLYVEEKYPEYYQALVVDQQTDLAAAQQNLTGDQVLLSYFLTSDTVLCAVIKKSTIKIIGLGPRSEIDSLRSRYQEILFSPDRDNSAKKEAHYRNLGTISHALYEFLIAPLDSLPNRIIVIADAQLHSLNFDLFLKDPLTVLHPGNWPYLLKQHAISYNHSIATWLQMCHLDARSRKFMGVLPKTDIAPWEDLPKSREMLQSLPAKYGVNYYEGSEATANTMRNAFGYGIIDIETHAKADARASEFSFMLLNDTLGQLDSFYLHEMNDCNFDGAFVMIGSCETHVGEYARGEGIVSLARGVTQARASSLITSLWPVKDLPSAEIKREFYTELFDGKPKDLALQSAKMQYLENGQSDLLHPNDWGALILIGDVRTLPKQKLIPWWVWVLGGLLILGIGQRIIRASKHQFPPAAA